MLAYLIKKIKEGVITLRYSILSIFVSLFIIAILILITIHYNRYSHTMIFIATNLMQEAANSLYHNFNEELIKVKRDNETTARLIKENILNRNNINQMMNYIDNLNRELYIIQQAYWCDELGDCVNSTIEKDDSIKSDLIFNSKKPPQREFLYRDINGNVIKKITTYKVDYDPRVRPWYIEAIAAHKTIWTDVYLLKEQPYLAFTIATPIYKSNGEAIGVFGMDIRLDWLSKYLEKLKVSKNSKIFIVNKNGMLVAFPEVYKKEAHLINQINIHSINMPWIIKSFDLFKEHGKTFFSFSYGGKTYLANYMQSQDEAVKNWIIGIVAPEDDFTSSLRNASLIDIQIGLIILLLGILLVSNFATRIVKPIKELVKETQKIKNFELNSQERIKSRIKEVMLLADAIYSMKLGLKSFQKYVPASLVRQLIELGEDVSMGGTKKNLVIFFSDIKDFTTISENMDPSELLELMCEYFDEISKIIVLEKGTIDKYIGDAIMAFWGAPFPVDTPCENAARAALKTVQKINELNGLWKNRHKASLITRIGIHIGDVIVGNVGSSERVNYTALGDAINVASRLEGLNKIYGTTIIVSDAIYQAIKNQFIFRKLDCVAVKGKTMGGYIYQLIAENRAEITFDIDKYRDQFEKGFVDYQQQHWIQAIDAFSLCLKIYPEDTVAPIFIERCQKFKLHPPIHWDGIWRN